MDCTCACFVLEHKSRIRRFHHCQRLFRQQAGIGEKRLGLWSYACTRTSSHWQPSSVIHRRCKSNCGDELSYQGKRGWMCSKSPAANPRACSQLPCYRGRRGEDQLDIAPKASERRARMKDVVINWPSADAGCRYVHVPHIVHLVPTLADRRSLLMDQVDHQFRV